MLKMFCEENIRQFFSILSRNLCYEWQRTNKTKTHTYAQSMFPNIRCLYCVYVFKYTIYVCIFFEIFIYDNYACNYFISPETSPEFP